jgi:hypothetical protein
MSNWRRVYSTKQPYRAEIVKAVLEDKGMHPVLVNKKDSNYHFGFYEVYVAPDFVIPAIKIIEDEINFGE